MNAPLSLLLGSWFVRFWSFPTCQVVKRTTTKFHLRCRIPYFAGFQSNIPCIVPQPANCESPPGSLEHTVSIVRDHSWVDYGYECIDKMDQVMNVFSNVQSACIISSCNEIHEYQRTQKSKGPLKAVEDRGSTEQSADYSQDFSENVAVINHH